MCELRVCIMSGWWTGLMYWGWAAIWLTCSTGAEWWRTLTYSTEAGQRPLSSGKKKVEHHLWCKTMWYESNWAWERLKANGEREQGKDKWQRLDKQFRTWRVKKSWNIAIESHQTDLQIELIAGVTPVEFRAGESELSLTQSGRSPVLVAYLSQCLLIVGHGVHALEQEGKTCYTKICPVALCISL